LNRRFGLTFAVFAQDYIIKEQTPTLAIGLTYRYFPITSRTRGLNDGAGPFVSAVLDFLNTSYKYLGTSNVLLYDEFGNYIGFTPDESTIFHKTVNNLGLTVNIGYNWRIFDILYMEAYLGVGVKMSDYVHDSGMRANLGENNWDTGYSGYFVSSGFRIGVYLNRYKYVMK